MTSSLFEKALSVLNRIKAGLFTKLVTPGFFSVGKGCLIVPPFRSVNLALVQLGANVTVNNDCWFLTLANAGDERSPKLIIKDGAVVGGNATISAAKSIVIGERVLFAGNVFIADHGHAYEDCTRPIRDQGIRKVAPVAIGDGSWLGQNAVILPGSVIGKHCVVGANSVVNSMVPDFSVVAGNPARVIRKFNAEKGVWESV
jgi:acetyltransferase-like isoleucine patch superfamily enzyme